jgi:iron-sulfur cluster insertion protein
MMSAVPITMTQAAAGKVWELITEENNFELKLRVHVQGGGCSGFQYGFSFQEAAEEDDTIIDTALGRDEAKIVKLLVDSMSYQYLVGAEIDYVDDLAGAHFVIRNPNAQSTCGCGSSFSA